MGFPELRELDQCLRWTQGGQIKLDQITASDYRAWCSRPDRNSWKVDLCLGYCNNRYMWRSRRHLEKDCGKG